MRVQSFSSSSTVKAGQTASFAIWVWTLKAPSTAVSVSVKVAYAQFISGPKFSVCPIISGARCKLGNLSVGIADELQVGSKVGKKAQLGEQVQVTAKASAKGATPFTASATDVVAVNPHASPSTPVVNLPPPTTLPPISGTGVSPGNPSNLFPTVGPASSSPGATTPPSLGLPQVKPHKKVVHAADVSATVPLDPRLIGGQLAGLAVLAGAVAIAIARLSLRSPKPPEDKGKDSSK